MSMLPGQHEQLPVSLCSGGDREEGEGMCDASRPYSQFQLLTGASRGVYRFKQVSGRQQAQPTKTRKFTSQKKGEGRSIGPQLSIQERTLRNRYLKEQICCMRSDSRCMRLNLDSRPSLNLPSLVSAS